jgi:hypothetical protein
VGEHSGLYATVDPMYLRARAVKRM